MPPRYAYWTILAGGLPTAFRAAERDELLPTFHRLREKHPDAELKYFAQGRLWASPDEARRARADGEREVRGRDWRPGGEHRDPRQKFKDEKRKQNQERRQQRFDRKQQPHAGSDRQHAPRDDRRSSRDWRQKPPREKPHGDPFAREVRAPERERPQFKRDWSDRDRSNKPPREKPHGERFGREVRAPKQDRSQTRTDWSNPARGNKPPREKPHGDPLRQQAKPSWRKPSSGGGPRDRRGPHGHDRFASDRSQSRDSRDRPRTSWGDRPPKKGWHQGEPRKREWSQNQEPTPHEPPRGPSPTREPRPSESPAPTPPPRPSEPEVPPPGPPERGRHKRPFHGRFRK